ncbi:cyclic nucleotide-regulated small mechanosensitive ion channel [Beutenbergia cavernae DSM 12333]|uniref:Cyclic nucleotide-regulated small mechanosensitive ion channel n=1 Tax=Beutenbergia cavernae (strain ATCC BAA-8 / DSM 12333 / CCUG 43141 / JCM 11478 / NBRC 16432 / NCIMB 13614 / HKI 0122) TaxID=471853 RepID=C5BVQ1_BEUC1|nr:mechanosensitive ion channel family protein [Beutenbergia cavernae]ACQ78491.1 cyclic nucleotide-regulated small mechanosensitive ion channel [Beutenbergia cavernae DSM 12333]
MLEEAWFAWAAAVVVGVPLALFLLTQWQDVLRRRGSALLAPVSFLRNAVVPAFGIFVLVRFAAEFPPTNVWVRVLATVAGVALLVFALSALNAMMFAQAREGSWRARIPSIFVEIARLVLVVLGMAVILSWVWGADVGGMFAALGVTGIVLGFALQGAIGSVVSGLLLLFEQPFQIGDRLSAAGAVGRVVEVNWRSVHIETGEGVHIIPNSSLGGSSFVNLSEPEGRFDVAIDAVFAADDPPATVIGVLRDVARDLPTLRSGARPSVALTAPHTYTTTLPLHGPADESSATSVFRLWLWYAARRAGLSLDGGSAGPSAGDEASAAAMAEVQELFGLSDAVVDGARDSAVLRVYGDGEILHHAGAVARGLLFVLAGRVQLSVSLGGEARAVEAPIERGGYTGEACLAREPHGFTAHALGETRVLFVPAEVTRAAALAEPQLAQRIGAVADARRRLVREIARTGERGLRELDVPA